MTNLMTSLLSRISTGVVAFAALGAAGALAAPMSVTGSTAVAVAAVVAQHSPVLSAYEKRTIAGFFAGNQKSGGASKQKLTVTADTVMCRISNVDITARRCELTFKKVSRSFSGREANELYATLASAGVVAEGAVGSMIQTVSKLSCTLDPAAIRDNSGAGADCTLQTDQ